jgi:hypothetical protein
MKRSIVIPVDDEEPTIGEVVDRIWAVELGDIEREVIVDRVSYHTCQSP